MYCVIFTVTETNAHAQIDLLTKYNITKHILGDANARNTTRETKKERNDFEMRLRLWKT